MFKAMQEDSPTPVPIEPSSENEPDLGQSGPEEQTRQDAEQNADEKTGSNERNKLQSIGYWLNTHKKISIPIAIVLVILLLAVVPWTRYHLAGPFVKKDLTVKLTDATADIPISGALVSSDGVQALTDSNGVAKLHLSVGSHQLNISKRYYTGDQVAYTLPITGNKQLNLVLVATGRQVGVNVKDLLSDKALSSVEISVAGISATTDQSGKALLVLPAGANEQEAVLNRAGYNQAKVKINVSAKEIIQNNFSLTPAGKVYFLSNRTGKLNVMKADLDGTNPEVVISATGYEQTDSSALSQSPDGRYVVLQIQRSASDKTPQLFILSTDDDRLLSLDSGDFNFSIIGWSGDNLIYKSSRNSVPVWQANKERIKSYNATTGKTTVLDSSAGSDPDSAVGQAYGETYVSGDKVVFNKYWSGSKDASFDGRKNNVAYASVDGKTHQVVSSYDAANTYALLFHYAPKSFYIEVDSTDTAEVSYYDFTVGGSFKQISKLDSSKVYSGVEFYYSSNGDETYWSESRDGKQTLITQDADGNNQTGPSAYYAAGWYTDKYLLATNKDQDELYVLSATTRKPIKVADYQSTYVY